MNTALVRTRLQALRERHRMTQDDLARALGFNDRQTLSQIELGDRKLGAEEMVRAAEVFDVAIDYFTDPFELAGEGQFSWRQSGVDAKALDRFEQTAGRWIAGYRHLSRLRGDSIHSSLRRVALSTRSSYEQAISEGEAIGAALHLGAVPSARLADVVQNDLDTLVLHVDMVRGVSGAACQLEQLNTILINRQEPPARRTYDLAHELFHLLTWQSMPPKRLEAEHPLDRDEKRIEQLADNFAAGLLMPSSTIDALLDSETPANPESWIVWLRRSAATLGVSVPALKWRLVNARRLKRSLADSLPDELLKVPSRLKPADAPGRFGKRFVDVMAWGIEDGHISARRAATLLGQTVDDLHDLFGEHGLPAPFNL